MSGREGGRGEGGREGGKEGGRERKVKGEKKQEGGANEVELSLLKHLSIEMKSPSPASISLHRIFCITYSFFGHTHFFSKLLPLLSDSLQL